MMYEGLDQQQIQTVEMNEVVENLEEDAPVARKRQSMTDASDTR